MKNLGRRFYFVWLDFVLRVFLSGIVGCLMKCLTEICIFCCLN